jgi:hypothetical protein
MMRSKTTTYLAVAALLSVNLFGCAQPKMVRDDYERRISGIRSIGLLAPDIAYYDVSFGGVKEKNDDMSRLADQNVTTALREALSARGFDVKIIARDGEGKDNLKEISELFTLIAESYQYHVVGASPENVFPHKAASFDYSVGPIGDILDAERVDALFLVEGGGRGHGLINPGGTVLIVGLIDRTGALLWHKLHIQPDNGFFKRKTLGDPDSVRGFISDIFATMPEVHK